jgi:hypothetical protein
MQAQSAWLGFAGKIQCLVTAHVPLIFVIAAKAGSHVSTAPNGDLHQ